MAAGARIAMKALLMHDRHRTRDGIGRGPGKRPSILAIWTSALMAALTAVSGILLCSGLALAADPLTPTAAELAAIDALVIQGELRQAVAELERLDATLPADAPADTRGEIGRRLGAALGSVGEDARAKELLGQAIRLADQARDTGLKAATLNEL